MMSNPNTDQTHYSQYHSTSNLNQNINILPVTENSGKLKVEDALKYIDRVKSRFKEDVYKKFLEVMKDFKAQKINTESVIQNVLTLFHGHQDLIEGFNTFLPPGYQMSTYQIQNVTNFAPNNISNLHSTLNISQPVISSQSFTIVANPNVVKTHPEASNNQSMNLNSDQITYVPKEKTEISQPQQIGNPSNPHTNLKTISANIPQAPTEFNHAVEYVNKIKNRFQKQPDVYKRFLEILHWYQKEQKNPDLAKRKQTETEVSQEVAKLFDNEQDLLEEFSTFLPDSTDEMCQSRKTPGGGSSSSYKSSLTATTQPYFNTTGSVVAAAASVSANAPNPLNLASLNDRSKFSTKSEPSLTDPDKDKEGLGAAPESSFYRTNSTTLSASLSTATGGINPTSSAVAASILSNNKRSLQETSSSVSVSSQIASGQERRLNSACLSPSIQVAPVSVSSNSAATPISAAPPSKRLRTDSSISGSHKDSNNSIINRHTAVINSTELKHMRHHDVVSAMCKELLNQPNDTAYNSFLNTVNLFNQRVIGPEELKNIVKPFFSKRSEVWISFLRVLDRVNEAEKKLSLEHHSNYAYDRMQSTGYNAELVGQATSNSYLNNISASKAGANSGLNITGAAGTGASVSAAIQSNSHSASGSTIHAGGSSTFCRKNIELSKLELCGSHYRVLPEDLTEPRSAMQMRHRYCKEVLNYNFLCHRSLSAEDAPFVFSKKNSYEESVFKIEDERYEIDMVMEVNKAAMVRLADLQVRLKTMTTDDLKHFNFESSLYKSSSILFYKAIQRIYGDKAGDIINGLRNHPTFVVPIVLERLKEKDVEWKEKLKQFRRHWRDQDQYLLKSLDYQAIHFRAKDAAFTRPKALLNNLDANVKMKPVYLNMYQDQTSYSRLLYSLLSIKRTWRLERPDKWGSYALSSHAVQPGQTQPAISASNSAAATTPTAIPSHNTSTSSNTAAAVGATSTPTTPGISISGTNYSHCNGGVVERLNSDRISCDYHLLLLFPCDVYYAKAIVDHPFQNKQYMFDKLDWFELLSDASSLVIHHLKRQTNFSKDDKTHMKNLMRLTLQDFFLDERFPMSDDEEDSNSGNNGVDSDHSMTSNKASNTSRHTNRSATKKSVIEQDCAGVSDTAATSSKVESQKQYKILLGSRSWYVFIRLYHILIDRLAALKIKADQIMSIQQEEKNQNTHDVADLLLYKKSIPLHLKDQLRPEEYYQEAINLVKDLLDSCEDTVNFEDKLREMFGIHAYIWFSMDKLITTLVKQLQSISCSDAYSRKLMALFKQCSKSFHGQDDQGNVLRIMSCGTGGSVEARQTNIIAAADEFAYLQAASRLSVHYNEPLVLLQFQRNSNTSGSGNPGLGRQVPSGLLSVTLLDVPPPVSSQYQQNQQHQHASVGLCVSSSGDRIMQQQLHHCHRQDADDEDIEDLEEMEDEEEDDDEEMEGMEDADDNNSSCSGGRHRPSRTAFTSGCTSKVKTESIKQEQLLSEDEQLNSQRIFGWRRYVERYVRCADRLGLSDGLASLHLEQRIVVPLFLVRSLRGSVRAISTGVRVHHKPSLSDDALSAKKEDTEKDTDEMETELVKNENTQPLLVTAEPVVTVTQEKPTVTDMDSDIVVDSLIVVPSTDKSVMPIVIPQVEWHNVIVSLTTHIFHGASKEKLSQFLMHTVMTGHMCPASEEGQNLMAQYETNKLTWSVGSTGIFHHQYSQTNNNTSERSKATVALRKKKFQQFHNKWINKQKS